VPVIFDIITFHGPSGSHAGEDLINEHARQFSDDSESR
jgi:hypothetical protein